MPPAPQNPKVFCVGFQKTGTTSLYFALKTLGLRVTGSVGLDLSAEELAANGAALCIETMRDFDAAEDMPWPLYFRELDKAYPGSKFILSVRDADAWHASIDRHFGDVDTPMHRFVYGADAGRARGAKARWVERMIAHEIDVKSHFANRPDDLLVMDLEAGDDWTPLCAFLGVEIPPQPFPRKNRAADRRKLSYRMKKRVDLMMGRVPTPERLL